MNSLFPPRRWLWALCVLITGCAWASAHPATAQDAQDPIRVLLIDGQNNHAWQVTTPLVEQTLEGTGRFTVDVATAPGPDGDMSTFQPEFAGYAVVVSNYNGQPWPDATRKAFEDFVAGGGGFVSVHAADNSFPEWSEYNRMIGLGGWGGRNEKDGPYVRWQNGRIVRDDQKGPGGSHGQRHPFEIIVRDATHPITAGLPRTFTQAEDELYAQLRGPAENMHVLATALSDKRSGGTGHHEPVLMTIHYGNGRVFHTTLGHDATAMKGIAFQATLQRGTEWAATGRVTLPPIGAQTLTSGQPASRDPSTIGAKDQSTNSKSSANQSTEGEPTETNAQAAAAADIPDIETEGWVALANGKDLKGWSLKNGTASFAWEDGAVVGRTAVGSPNSFLCTDLDFQNFELTFEVRLDTGLNSGVQIRSLSTPQFKQGRVHGPQVEIEARDADGKGDAGYIFSEGTDRGWLSTERPIQDAFVNDQWNRYHVRAVGNRFQTWVNGRQIEDLSDDQVAKRGFIGLQVHGIEKDQGPYEVRWRDLRIRILPDDQPPAL